MRLKINFHSFFLRVCGLRPRIERHLYTFEDTDLVRQNSLAHLEATVAQCSLYVRKMRLKINFHSFFLRVCGLRPRIERHLCTFEDTDLVRQNSLAHLEATVAQCSLYVRKMRMKINFHSFFLHICNFCSTFAAIFDYSLWRSA